MKAFHQIWLFVLRFQLLHQTEALNQVGSSFKPTQTQRVRRTTRFVQLLEHKLR
jgi:hypothetical protein